jgi:hypothetical protein
MTTVKTKRKGSQRSLWWFVDARMLRISIRRDIGKRGQQNELEARRHRLTSRRTVTTIFHGEE